MAQIDDKTGLPPLDQSFMAAGLGELTGRDGWVAPLSYLSVLVMFLAGVWTGWRFFAATDVLVALHWGLPSAVLLIGSVAVKVSLIPMIEAARTREALHRLEKLIVAARL